MRIIVFAHLALGWISVNWDKIFHLKALSHLTGMDILPVLLENTNKQKNINKPKQTLLRS
jgi:hypothetical protein